MRLLSLYLIGLMFGIGISISGMANPAKVLNFFDIMGAWDPSLIFVMGAGLLVTVIGYRLVLAQDAPRYGDRFRLPTKRDIDPRLIAGSALFGIGWGIAGFCPGGAVPALGTGRAGVFIFIVSLICGIFITKRILHNQTAP
ncbi:DUF6691 family protein [Amylibacter marinus]|nr:DUF6691 family protein [Amylibacter marinus]